MGTTVGDYDGDGRLDIFKTNFSDDTSTLYHNNLTARLRTSRLPLASGYTRSISVGARCSSTSTTTVGPT